MAHTIKTFLDQILSVQQMDLSVERYCRIMVWI